MAVDLQDQPGPLLSLLIQNNCLVLYWFWNQDSPSGTQWRNMVIVTCLYVLKYLTCKVVLGSAGNCLVVNISQDLAAPSTIVSSISYYLCLDAFQLATFW